MGNEFWIDAVVGFVIGVIVIVIVEVIKACR